MSIENCYTVILLLTYVIEYLETLYIPKNWWELAVRKELKRHDFRILRTIVISLHYNNIFTTIFRLFYLIQNIIVKNKTNDSLIFIKTYICQLVRCNKHILYQTTEISSSNSQTNNINVCEYICYFLTP